MLHKKLLTTSIFLLLAAVVFAQSPRKSFKTGRSFNEAKNYKEAVIHFTKAIDQKPEYTKAYLGRAFAYEQMGKIKDAAEDYKRLSVFEPKEEDIFFNAGRLFLKLEEYKEALKFLNHATLLDKKMLKAYLLKIKALDKLGDYKKAYYAAEQALKIEETAINFYNRAYLGDSLQSSVKAIADYRKAIAKNPRFLLAYESLAKALLRAEQFDKAKKTCEKIINLDSKNFTGYWVRAEVYRNKMDFPQAINDLSRLSVIAPENADVYYARGSLYQEFNQHQNAINDFSKVISLDKKNYWAYYKRATSYEEITDYSAAIKDYAAVKKSGISGNVESMLKDVTARLFELNREEKSPEIVIIDPKPLKKGIVDVVENAKTVSITGQINDQSDIKYVKVNDQDVELVEDSGTNNKQFTATVPIEGAVDFTIIASDVYGNVQTSVFKLRRTEVNPPIANLITPYASDNGEVYLDSNDPSLYIEGKIEDESLIKSIFVDGATASYLIDRLNPKFTATVNVQNKNKITVKVEDIYGNISRTVFTLNRENANMLANNPMGKTWFIFIENSNYQTFASLEGPTKDVTLMKKALANYKINKIIHKKDLSKKALEKFFAIDLRDLVRSNKVSSLVIWYAGHGKFINETGYWIPIDAKRDDEFSYFNTNSLKASMQSYSKYITHTLIISDACESGPSFYQAMRSTPQLRSCDDVTATRFRSSQVFSSAGYELATDDSQFTRTFANSLTYNQSACIPIETIVSKVSKAVAKNNTQKPQFGKIAGLEDENGTFFFIRKD